MGLHAWKPEPVGHRITHDGAAGDGQPRIAYGRPRDGRARDAGGDDATDDWPADRPDATGKPTTGVPTTGQPTTGEPTTGVPTTGDPAWPDATGKPTTGVPTTGQPTTGEPTTGVPTTGDPALPDTTGKPTTGVPTTGQPTTGKPTTGVPTTGEPTTGEPTTGTPTTGSPATPTTDSPASPTGAPATDEPETPVATTPPTTGQPTLTTVPTSGPGVPTTLEPTSAGEIMKAVKANSSVVVDLETGAEINAPPDTLPLLGSNGSRRAAYLTFPLDLEEPGATISTAFLRVYVLGSRGFGIRVFQTNGWNATRGTWDGAGTECGVSPAPGGSWTSLDALCAVQGLTQWATIMITADAAASPRRAARTKAEADDAAEPFGSLASSSADYGAPELRIAYLVPATESESVDMTSAPPAPTVDRGGSSNSAALIAAAVAAAVAILLCLGILAWKICRKAHPTSKKDANGSGGAPNRTAPYGEAGLTFSDAGGSEDGKSERGDVRDRSNPLGALESPGKGSEGLRTCASGEKTSPF
eukprot:TRINITY_DN2634_c0_g1_i1.p1 TRINITY_DN2634_c0_g1~~TRINITY_DN2634_c0_g1_i1.p1  ORF type:complete len:529 (+),score=0.96 TRINITY_DN2634_c0_g1_i1:777-2363(+)